LIHHLDVESKTKVSAATAAPNGRISSVSSIQGVLYA
jgi:hypothetical protein